MKKIVCELCECTEFAKDGGMFVCQGCGTKYTVEEAKGMMVEVEGDAPAVSAPVATVDNQQLENILVLANNAYEADNKKEAENYCNRAIELDARCYKAWFLKGKAAGWQSTIENLRIEEAAYAFCKAIDFAPQDEKEKLKNQAVDELKSLGIALISLRKNRFAADPVEAELKGFATDRRTVLNGLKILLEHGNSVGIPEGFMSRVACLMNDAGCAALRMAREAWGKVDWPNDKDFTLYLDWVGNIAQIFRDAIDIKDYDPAADITRYENLIVVLEDPISKCSYKLEWNSWSNSYEHVKSHTLSDSAIQSRRNEVQRCKEKIAALKKQVEDEKKAKEREAAAAQKRRIEEYWAAHKEEKENLETERAALEKRKLELATEISILTGRISAINDAVNFKSATENEAEKLHATIRELSAKRQGLGLFAGKEKKRLDEEIAAIKVKVAELDVKAAEEKRERENSAREEAKPFNAKKDELNKELNTITAKIAKINSTLSSIPNN